MESALGKLPTVAFIIATGISNASANGNREVSGRSEQALELVELVTAKGKTYRKVAIRKKTPAGIRITHAGGAATIPYEELAAALKHRLGGFDREEADAFRDEAARKRQRLAEHNREAAAAQTARYREEERRKAFDKAKTPTKAIVEQTLDKGALCSVSTRIPKKFVVRIPRALSGYDVHCCQRMVWTEMSKQWFYIAGLPANLVDGDCWEGWTVVSNPPFVYESTPDKPKTFRRLTVVEAPQRR